MVKIGEVIEVNEGENHKTIEFLQSYCDELYEVSLVIAENGEPNFNKLFKRIALKLKEVFELQDINELPIAFNIAWYEQKAVIVLLSLLYLGVKNIHLGPTLPAFLSPNVAKVLVENFGIGGITNVEDDLKMFLD